MSRHTNKTAYARAHRRRTHLGLKMPGVQLRRGYGYRGEYDISEKIVESHGNWPKHKDHRTMPLKESIAQHEEVWAWILEQEWEDYNWWVWQRGGVPCVSSEAYLRGGD